MFQKISILPPQKGLEYPGGGGLCKAKTFKEMYEELLVPEWWGGGLRKNPFGGGGMDIFWNYTMEIFDCAPIWQVAVVMLKLELILKNSI